MKTSDKCPLCRTNVSEAELVVAAADEGDCMPADAVDAPSSKTAALLQYIQQHSGDDAGMPAKFVVFSQFTRYLDLVQAAVTGGGYTVARLDGSTSAAVSANHYNLLPHCT